MFPFVSISAFQPGSASNTGSDGCLSPVLQTDSTKYNLLRTRPENFASNFGQAVQLVSDCQEWIAGELSGFAREPDGSVCNQHLRFAHSTGIDNHLSRSWIARRVLKPDIQIEVS